jgi:small-conductance mechanosensitive channel
MKIRLLNCSVCAMVLLTGASLQAGEVTDSEKVSKLLSETKTMAFQLKEDAATMETFTRNPVSMQTHAAALLAIKDHVNALAKQNMKLQEAKAEASPWQRTAIERIAPYVDELGGYTSAAIEHVNKTQQHSVAEYNDFLEANADYSSDLASMIANFVDYGRAKYRMDRLGGKLEVPRD